MSIFFFRTTDAIRKTTEPIQGWKERLLRWEFIQFHIFNCLTVATYLREKARKQDFLLSALPMQNLNMN